MAKVKEEKNSGKTMSASGSVSNSAAGYEYTPGDGSDAEKRDQMRGVQKSTDTGSKVNSTAARTGSFSKNSSSAVGNSANVPAAATNGYQAKGTYNDELLRKANSAQGIDYYKNYYDTAKAKGDTAGMEWAHQQAEAIRAGQGYSGGVDGSGYNSLVGTYQQRMAAKNNANAAYAAAMNGATQPGNTGMTGSAANPVSGAGSVLTAASSNGQTYMIGSQKGLDFVNGASPGATMIGGDGSTWIKNADGSVSITKNGTTYTVNGTGGMKMPVTTMALPSYQAQDDYVTSLYDSALTNSMQSLMSAYENSRANLSHTLEQIPETYQTQRNAVAADSERQKAAFNERAASVGMNAGNGTQAALAFSNTLQNNLGALDKAQANAINEGNFQLDQLYREYQQQVAQAVAQNDYQKATALLEEHQKAAQSVVDTAMNQASVDLQNANLNLQTRQMELAQQNEKWQQEFNERVQQWQQDFDTRVQDWKEQQQAWQNQYDIATALANYGYYGGLSQYGLSDTDINKLLNRNTAVDDYKAYLVLRQLGYL